MKASELRIGNLFYMVDRSHYVHLPITTPLKVIQIGLAIIDAVREDQNPATVSEWLHISTHDISPIRLTEEWLTKFGFEMKERDVPALDTIEFFIKDGHEFIQDVNGKWFLSGYSWNTHRFSHVHQLQNLYFALTGNELELK